MKLLSNQHTADVRIFFKQHIQLDKIQLPISVDNIVMYVKALNSNKSYGRY